MMKLKLWFGAAAVFLCAAFLFAVLLWRTEVYGVYVVEPAVEVVVPKGAGVKKAAQILAATKVIKNALWFEVYVRLEGIGGQLKAGEYQFSGETSLKSVAEKLAAGEVIERSLTIPEGKSLAEIKKIVLENPYLSGEITLSLQEGDILPETYHFTRGELRDNVLKRARTAMKKALEEAFAGRTSDLPIKSAEELLILASIVEKETGVSAERAKVASVFVNRLNLGMKLQTDPTVIYAVTNGEMNLGRPLYKKDLGYDSPFNTYVYAGLPPAPICSPGKEALRAAAGPEKTDFLYFVADGVSGGHRFAKSLSEHNKNVMMYRKSKR
ncbi:MAG: endolytic transglycosylase MltG [Alphaproteobacteria bacterium]|nr:endolytic transglycosylase MltG [Alphaproteobacteria bacterium]